MLRAGRRFALGAGPRVARRGQSSAIKVTLRLPEDAEVEIRAEAGSTLLETLERADLSDVWEGGACGGACQCSTCRVVVDVAPTPLAPRADEEEDMLETAARVSKTDPPDDFTLPSSRLACQVVLRSPQDDGLVVSLPDDVTNVLEVPVWLRGPR